MNAKAMKGFVQKAMNELLYEHSNESVARNFTQDFIQHNPFSADGQEHLMTMTQFTFVWEPARWVVDGDIVAYQGMYTATNPLDPENPLLCVDMWRIEDGKIAEHWDALTILPFGKLAAKLAGGGDGLKDVPEATVAANKAMAERFMREVLQNGNTAELDNLLSDSFAHHSENGEVGKDGVISWINSLGGSVPSDVKRVIGSGDLVMVHSHITHPDYNVANFDIFCFGDDSKITDHWSTSQAIAKPGETQNPHPHF
ncbi:MAG: nuclear transport factor 2 family protein [Chloroflexota bacterium]